MISFFLFLGGYSNNTNAKYPIKKIEKSSERAVIAIGNSLIEKGDMLELHNDTQLYCRVRVLKVRKKRALISTKNCWPDISKKNRVVDADIESELLDADIESELLEESDSDSNSRKRRVPSYDLESNSLVEMERSYYVTGGVLGTILGLGIGHGVQGRWESDGWFFTVGQFLSASLYVSAVNDYDSCVADGDSSCNDSSGFWALILLVSRVGEIVSVWNPSSKEYRIVKEKKRSRFFAIPFLKKGHMGLSFGMSF